MASEEIRLQAVFQHGLDLAVAECKEKGLRLSANCHVTRFRAIKSGNSSQLWHRDIGGQGSAILSLPLQSYGFFFIWQLHGKRRVEYYSDETRELEVLRLEPGDFAVLSFATIHRGRIELPENIGAVCLHGYVILQSSLTAKY